MFALTMFEFECEIGKIENATKKGAFAKSNDETKRKHKLDITTQPKKSVTRRERERKHEQQSKQEASLKQERSDKY